MQICGEQSCSEWVQSESTRAPEKKQTHTQSLPITLLRLAAVADSHLKYYHSVVIVSLEALQNENSEQRHIKRFSLVNLLA